MGKQPQYSLSLKVHMGIISQLIRNILHPRECKESFPKNWQLKTYYENWKDFM